jgi:hypothetical protein
MAVGVFAPCSTRTRIEAREASLQRTETSRASVERLGERHAAPAIGEKREAMEAQLGDAVATA